MKNPSLALVVGLALASSIPAQEKSEFAELRRHLVKAVESGEIHAIQVLVGQGDRLIHESYVGLRENDQPIGPDTRFCIGSCSKSMAAALVLNLVGDAKLKLDEPISAWLPSLAKPKLASGQFAVRAPTMRELLQHTGGIYSQRKRLTRKQSSYIRDFRLTLERSVDGIAGQPLQDPPGHRFAYSGAGYCVLGRVAELATRQTLEALMQERVFGPLGMRRTTWFPNVNDPNIANAGDAVVGKRAPHRLGKQLALSLVGGSVYSTARDCGRFLRMIAGQGHVGKAQIFSRELWQEMTKRTGPNPNYGFGWKLVTRDKDEPVTRLTHNGSLYGYRSCFEIDLETGRYLVVNLTLGKASARSRQRPQLAIFARVRATLSRRVVQKSVPDNAKLLVQIDKLAKPLVKEKTTVGLIVGVLHNGHTTFRGYGQIAKGNKQVPGPNTVWEIGSITKVFTGILLADATLRGLAKLDDPVAKHLPKGVKMPSFAGKPIRLIHLTTHGSSLPRMPVNFRPKNVRDPYVDYQTKQLYEGLGRTRIRRAPGSGYAYSNLAAGLLGHLLCLMQDKDYETLVRERITKALGMTDTAISLSKAMKARLAQPYAQDGQERRNWNFGCLAACGALRSSASDMLRFAAANIDPDKTKIASRLRAAQVIRSPKWRGPRLGLGWHFEGERLFHNGETGGYASYLTIDTKRKFAVVVIANSTSREIDKVGRQLAAWLARHEQGGK